MISGAGEDCHATGRATGAWGIAAVAFVGGVGGGVVFPILPVIGLDLGMSGFMIGLVLAANRIARLGFNPLTGGLVDRFGARWPVAVGLAIEAVGTLCFSIGISADPPAAWFLAGRLIWGVGSSLLIVGVLTAVLAIAPVERRGGMTARVRTALSLGLPAGLVIGGLVADAVSANAAFLTATGLSGGGAFAALLLLPRGSSARAPSATTSAQSQLDGWHELVRVPLLGVIWSANALLFLSVSGVLLASLAVLIEQRSLFLPGFGAEGSAGLYMAVMMLARGGAALASGHYLDRARARTKPLIPAALLLAASFVGLALAWNETALLVLLLIVGVAAGALTIPLLTLLGDKTPAHLHGRALSIYQWAGDLGGAIGPIAGLALGHRYGFGPVYATVGVLLLILLPLLRKAIARNRAPRRPEIVKEKT